MAGWSQDGFHLQHLMELISRCEIDLYCGEAASAWRRLEAAWPAVEGSLLLRIQHSRLTQLDLRARVALATGDPALLGIVRDHARTVVREAAPWATGLAHVRLGAVAAAGGRGDEARDCVRRGADQLDAAGLVLHAASARLRLAWLDGGALEEAPAWALLAERGVQRPARWMAVYAPWPA